MVKSISIKDAELFELVRGYTLAGGDVKQIFKEAAAVLKANATKTIGNDYDVSIAAAEADVQNKLSELKERAAVLAKLKSKH